MKILFIDDHQLFRQSVAAQLVVSDPSAEIIEASSLNEALSALDRVRYDIVLTDLSLGEGDGLEVVRAAEALDPPPPVLVLSMYGEADRVVSALRAGARGYVTKSADMSCLEEALKTVAQGGHYFDQVALTALVNMLKNRASALHFKHESTIQEGGPFEAYGSLTDREQELFLLLVGDASIEAIAQRLCISPKTVENHRSNIYAKLGLSDRHALFHYARKLGLVS